MLEKMDRKRLLFTNIYLLNGRYIFDAENNVSFEKFYYFFMYFV